jgi:hypothetical protein
MSIFKIKKAVSENIRLKKNFDKAYREVVLYYYGLKHVKFFLFLFYIRDFFRRLKHRLFHKKIIIEKIL